jgi:hypothetical protein
MICGDIPDQEARVKSRIAFDRHPRVASLLFSLGHRDLRIAQKQFADCGQANIASADAIAKPQIVD